jgi:hypothetical protein
VSLNKFHYLQEIQNYGSKGQKYGKLYRLRYFSTPIPT